MSSGQLPRTRRYFPKMKVRGARRRKRVSLDILLHRWDRIGDSAETAGLVIQSFSNSLNRLGKQLNDVYLDAVKSIQGASLEISMGDDFFEQSVIIRVRNIYTRVMDTYRVTREELLLARDFHDLIKIMIETHPKAVDKIRLEHLINSGGSLKGLSATFMTINEIRSTAAIPPITIPERVRNAY